MGLSPSSLFTDAVYSPASGSKDELIVLTDYECYVSALYPDSSVPQLMPEPQSLPEPLFKPEPLSKSVLLLMSKFMSEPTLMPMPEFRPMLTC